MSEVLSQDEIDKQAKTLRNPFYHAKILPRQPAICRGFAYPLPAYLPTSVRRLTREYCNRSRSGS